MLNNSTSIKKVNIQCDTDFNLVTPIPRIRAFTYCPVMDTALEPPPSKIVFTINMTVLTKDEDGFTVYQEFETVRELRKYLRLQYLLLCNIAEESFDEDDLENVLSLAFYPGGVTFYIEESCISFPGRIGR